MVGPGIREGGLTGCALGLVAALLILAFRGTAITLLAAAVLALGAGALAAYLTRGATRAAPAAIPAGYPEAMGAAGAAWAGNAGLRAGATAGVVLGLVSAVALTAAAYQLIDSPAFRRQTTPLLAPLNSGADSLMELVAGCSGCFYLVVVPAITAGLGALGAGLAGLARAQAPAGPAG